VGLNVRPMVVPVCRWPMIALGAGQGAVVRPLLTPRVNVQHPITSTLRGSNGSSAKCMQQIMLRACKC
jgi:hypothetical protein